MRTVIVLVGLMFIPLASWACPKGEHDDNGACAYDTSASIEDSAKWVSDEKPPKTTTGEWQTAKVKVITLSPQSTVDDEIAAAKKWDVANGQPPRGVEK